MIRISDTNGNVLDVPSGNSVEMEEWYQGRISVWYGNCLKDGLWEYWGKGVDPQWHMTAWEAPVGRLYVETLGGDV